MSYNFTEDRQSEVLRATATLSLSKFLCVSAQFCEQNYQMLFRILEKSRHSNVRSNIAIALGDVAVSFSTIIDESNNELYKGLNDEDHVVKKNTLMVLTHLILNGMIKVKGQLGEMAKCVEDPDRRISDLAKLFFTELSTKQNTIYNNLPDGTTSLTCANNTYSVTLLFQSSATFPQESTRSMRRLSRISLNTFSTSSRRYC